MKKIWAYILPTALCFVLGGLAGWLQQDAIEEWYPLLDKPTLTPPNAVFPIAWSIIYLCMGISGGLVLTSEAPARKSAVRLWFLQLGCNFLWSILFFVCRSPLLGMADIVVLDVLVILYLVRSANDAPLPHGSSSLTSAGSFSPPTSTPIFSLRTGRGCKPGKGAMCSRTKI